MNEEPIKPGELVAGQYEIDRLVGSGGFAQVYRAVQSDLDRTVAVKILRPASSDEEVSPSKRAVDRFEREAKLVSNLQNPHTVTLYDYGTLPGGRLYMVLEYVDGTTLSELVSAEGPLPVERIVPILVQILDSLREAHVHEIVHRDIKPDNIMVFDRIGQRDAVKVLDFGVAKSVAREQSAVGGDRAGDELTAHGTVIGTPQFMSPEQLMGKALTPASDLFSVGILAYLMYAGDLPYRASDASAILRRMKAFEHDLGALENAPELLRSVGGRLLAPEVEGRYGSAEAVLEDLEQRDEVEMETQQNRSADSSTSATFPMGLDPEGRTTTTELTAVESGHGSQVSRVIVGPRTAGSLDEVDGREETRAGSSEEEVEPEAPEPETSGSGAISLRRGLLYGVGGLLGVAALAAFYLQSPPPESPGTQETQEMSDRRTQTEKRREGTPVAESRGAALRASRAEVGEALATGAEAARQAADVESDDRSENPPPVSGDGDEPARREGAETRRAPTTQTGASGVSESSDEPAATPKDETSDGPSVAPLDEVDEEQRDDRKGGEGKNPIEVEAWE